MSKRDYDGWAIKSPWSGLWLDSANRTRRKVIEASVRAYPCSSWKQKYRMGYRCVKIRIAKATP